LGLEKPEVLLAPALVPLWALWAQAASSRAASQVVSSQAALQVASSRVSVARLRVA
jgi:hypothetical protein